MAKKGEYVIENIYGKSYSAFEPTNLGTGNYPIQTGSLGLTLNPQTMNQLKEVSDKANTGVKHVEMEGISREFFDNIPKQQLEEIRRLNKLTGVSVSVHGPVIDTTGVDPRRGGYSEAERVLSEKKVLQTLERSHEINPEGNIPVNFHTAEGLPGSEFGPKRGEEGERIYNKIIAVDRESGRLIPLEKEKRHYPEMKELKPEIEKKILAGSMTPDQVTNKDYIKVSLSEGKIYTPEKNLEITNESDWDNRISQIIFNKERADEILERNKQSFVPFLEDFNKGKVDIRMLNQNQRNVLRRLQDAKAYLDETHKQVNTLFNRAYTYGDAQQREELEKMSEQFQKSLEKDKSIFGQSEAMHDLLMGLNKQGMAPNMYVPVEEFALEKSSQTYGNAAYQAYKKYGDSAPILNLENPPAGFALSTGEDVKNLVEGSRREFIKKAMEDKKMSRKEAEKAANKIIGATLDVGHMNMLRKYGYSEEDIINESAKLAPILKHVHLSDNFGFDHTELPMGMGNVPFKEIMKKLGKKGYDAKKIIEAGQWWQQFGTAPLMATLEQVGPAMYSSRVSPYWNQNVGFQQDYMGGYGLMLPQTNYETFGAGFSQLPTELGGQRLGGQGGRMSGRPME